MTFDPHKPARTRDGRPATLRRVFDDEDITHPYIFEVPPQKGCTPFPISINRMGRYLPGGNDSHLDLENYTPEPEPPPMPPFDPSKPVQTRDGRAARIICTDLKLKSDPATIVALVTDSFAGEVPRTYRASGRWRHDAQEGLDLVNIPEERTAWFVSYFDDAAGLQVTAFHHEQNARLALKRQGERAVALVPVTFKQGDGLTPPEPK